MELPRLEIEVLYTCILNTPAREKGIVPLKIEPDSFGYLDDSRPSRIAARASLAPAGGQEWDERRRSAIHGRPPVETRPFGRTSVPPLLTNAGHMGPETDPAEVIEVTRSGNYLTEVGKVRRVLFLDMERGKKLLDKHAGQ